MPFLFKSFMYITCIYLGKQDIHGNSKRYSRPLFGCQKWSPGPVLVRCTCSSRTTIGKGELFLATKSGPGEPFLAAKIGQIDHFWAGPIFAWQTTISSVTSSSSVLTDSSYESNISEGEEKPTSTPTILDSYDEQPVLYQNSINALECQSYISRVLAGILALQKPMEKPKTRLYMMLFWS